MIIRDSLVIRSGHTLFNCLGHDCDIYPKTSKCTLISGTGQVLQLIKMQRRCDRAQTALRLQALIQAEQTCVRYYTMHMHITDGCTMRKIMHKSTAPVTNIYE